MNSAIPFIEPAAWPLPAADVPVAPVSVEAFATLLQQRLDEPATAGCWNGFDPFAITAAPETRAPAAEAAPPPAAPPEIAATASRIWPAPHVTAPDCSEIPDQATDPWRLERLSFTDTQDTGALPALPRFDAPEASADRRALLRVWLPGHDLESYQGGPLSVQVEIPVRVPVSTSALRSATLPQHVWSRPVDDPATPEIVSEAGAGSTRRRALPGPVSRHLFSAPIDHEAPASGSTNNRPATVCRGAVSGLHAQAVQEPTRSVTRPAWAPATRLRAGPLGLTQGGDTVKMQERHVLPVAVADESLDPIGFVRLSATADSVPALETYAMEQTLEPEALTSLKFTFEEWLPGRPVSQIRIALEPTELGGLRITLRENAGQIHASIIADRPEALPMLSSQMAALKSALASRGVQFSSFSLTAAAAASAVGLTPAGPPAMFGRGRRWLQNEPDVSAKKPNPTFAEVIRS